MTEQVNLPYQLIFVYDDGDQFIAGEYGTLREALQAKIRCKHEIGQADICGRVLEVITILKGGDNESEKNQSIQSTLYTDTRAVREILQTH